MFETVSRPIITCPNSHIRSYSARPFVILLTVACTLSFVGGYLNVVTIMGFIHTGLSAGTGMTSKLSIEFAKANNTIELRFVFVIFSFVLGSLVSASIIGGSSFRIQRSYGLVLLLESALLFCAYSLEDNVFNYNEKFTSMKLSSYLVAFSCGLQNSMCTTFSGAVIRTTHVTGILTDIGLILGQAIFHPRTRNHLWRLKVLIPLYISFCCGGVTGCWLYRTLFLKSMFIPCIIIGSLGISHVTYTIVYLKNKKQKFDKLSKSLNNTNNLLHLTANTTCDIEINTNDNECCFTPDDNIEGSSESEDTFDIQSKPDESTTVYSSVP